MKYLRRNPKMNKHRIIKAVIGICLIIMGFFFYFISINLSRPTSNPFIKHPLEDILYFLGYILACFGGAFIGRGLRPSDSREKLDEGESKDD